MPITNVDGLVLIAIWAGCAVAAGRVARDSGRDPMWGGWLGALFGPIGLIYVILSKGAGLPAQGTEHVASSTPQDDRKTPVEVRVYRGATQEAAARSFAEDAKVAAAVGYQPTSEAWDGTTLTVTYRLR